MNRRGFLKGILIAPVTVGLVGATKTPVVKHPPVVIKAPSKAAHLMQIFSVEVDSQKKRNLYGKTAVLADNVGFDTSSIEIELEPHQPFSSGEVGTFYRIEATHAYLQVKIKEPGRKGQLLMDELRFDHYGTKYYLPLWIPKRSKITVRVKDNRKFIGGYTATMLLVGGTRFE